MDRLHSERIKKFKEISDLNYIYNKELEKACFTRGTACADIIDLANRTVLDKSVKNRAYEIVLNLKYDGYQGGLGSMVYRFFDKK